MYNNGIKVNLRYDKHGNLYEKIDGFTGTTYRYSYDLTGRIIGIKGNNGIGLDYIYDSLNRVSKYATKFNGVTNTTEFVYGSSELGQHNGILYGVKLNGTEKLRYSYDQLARMQNRTIVISPESEGNAEKIFTTNYTYLEGGTQGTTTTMIKTVENDSGTYEYSYDQLGNITEIKLNGVVYESYEYDHLGQLVKVTRTNDGVYTYTYDNGGNIVSVAKDGQTIKSYEYKDNKGWKDLLTEFNDDVIEYDDIGNPLQYRNGFNFGWSNGRQLTSVSKNGQTFNYLYNADGLRTRKTINTSTVTDYYWLDGVLLGQKTGNDYITYLYDENGTPYGIICNNTDPNAEAETSTYYYVFNAQGDVVGIIDESGTQVVSYDYSAWGEVLAITGTMADTIGQLNPIRYRGYYYDNETGFYYLQSRYYDPVTCRFLNADGLVSTGQGILATNMFAYCLNNPVNMSDSEGNWSVWATIAIIAAAATISIVVIACNDGFGARSSTTVTTYKDETPIIPDPSPITAKTGATTTQTTSSHGDDSKFISVYANKDALNPILSSSAGMNVNIIDFTLNVRASLDNIGIYGSVASDGTINGIGIRLNPSELKLGIEWFTKIQWDNTTDTVYTNISVNGWAVAAAYVLITTGQVVPAPSYAY